MPTIHPWTVWAEGLHVRAGRRTVVTGVDLALSAGAHGLLGPNGAGKTTLIRALATATGPSGGDVKLFGTSLSGGDLRDVRRRLGYLPQYFGYYRRFTVREFVEYMAWLKEVRKVDTPGMVQRAIDRVGLQEQADSRMKTLSGGMIRRAGIAQAIVNDPDLLLLDEPTTGLDPAQRITFRRLLRELAQDACVVVSTHLVEDVSATCTDVLVLDRGEILFNGECAELAAIGEAGSDGDSPLERGYSTLLERRGS